MIIYHEGLPRSGKSYAAMKDWIIPALQKSRPVYAYIEGLNHAKIAELAGISLDDCEQLLHQLTKEQVLNWHTIAGNDSLVILDEIQDFYPARKQPLDPLTTTAVTQHGHKGQDLLLMGQDLRDTHSLFKRRVDQKILFNKMDSVGLANRYSWQVCKSAGLERFEVISKGVASYDPKYFGTYKSHEDGTSNKGNVQDARANIFKSNFFRFVIPAGFVIAALGAWYVYGVFQTGFVKTPPSKSAPSLSQESLGSGVPSNVSIPSIKAVLGPDKAKEPPLPSEAVIDAPQDRIQALSSKYRIRVGGYWEGRGKRNGFVEWREVSGTLVNRLTFDEVQGMGYTVMANQFGTVITLVNGPIHYIATMWPLDSNQGVANQQQIDSTRGPQQSTFVATPDSPIVQAPPKPLPQIGELPPGTNPPHRTFHFGK